MFSIAIKYFLLLSDFDQLPHNVPVTATIADIEEKKGFIDYYVSGIKPVDEWQLNSPVTQTEATKAGQSYSLLARGQVSSTHYDNCPLGQCWDL